jgi:hypothetical protein
VEEWEERKLSVKLMQRRLCANFITSITFVSSYRNAFVDIIAENIKEIIRNGKHIVENFKKKEEKSWRRCSNMPSSKLR